MFIRFLWNYTDDRHLKVGKDECLNVEGKFILSSEWQNGVSGSRYGTGDHLLYTLYLFFFVFLLIVYVPTQYNFKWLYKLYQLPLSQQQLLKMDISISNKFQKKHLFMRGVKIQLNIFFLNIASLAIMKCWWKAFGNSETMLLFFVVLHHRYLNKPFVIKF